MNKIVELVNINKNSNDPIIRQVADTLAQPTGEANPPDLDLHVAKRDQNIDDLVQRIRQNNVKGNHNLTRAVEQILNHFGFDVNYTS